MSLLLLGVGGSAAGGGGGAEQGLLGFTSAGTIGASTTRYVAPNAYANIANTSEALVAIRWRVAGTIKNLNVAAAANSRSDATVITLRVNGADTALTVSITAGQTTNFADTTHEVAIADGDTVCFSIVCGGGTGTINTIRATAILETAGQIGTHIVTSSGASASATSRFLIPMGGPLTLNITEALTAMTALEACTLSRMAFDFAANDAATDCIVTSRKNSGAGNQSLTFTAGSTALQEEDDGISDSLAANDTHAINRGATTGNTTPWLASMKYTGAVAGRTLVGCGGGSVVTASTTMYTGLFGIAIVGSTETSVQHKVPYAARLSHLCFTVAANSTSTTSMTATVRVNGADTDVTATIGASPTTGASSVSADDVDIAAGDLISISFAGNDGNVTVSWVGLLITDLAA